MNTSIMPVCCKAAICKTTIVAAMILGPLAAHAQRTQPVKIIEPEQPIHTKKAASIDTEKFQAGIYTGMLSVEDFNTNVLVGFSFNYLIANRFMAQINYAISDIGRSGFEEREQLDFLTSDERTFSYLNVLAGYKIFDSRSFFGARRKYESSIYLLAGPAQVEFGGLSSTGATLGMSYRIVLTDWLVTTLDMRDHIVNSNNVFSNESEKITQTVEFALGLNAMF